MMIVQRASIALLGGGHRRRRAVRTTTPTAYSLQSVPMKTIVDPNTKNAPAEAFAFASECQFAEAAPRDDSGIRKMSIEVLARTGQPVYHWYWDWIVHDMAGMKAKPRIAFDYRHDPDEPIGYADKITAKKELRLSGELLSRSPEDEAAKIMDLGPAGVPYEASIHFDHRSLVLEYLPDGATTTVNGNKITGPITIVREWELLRCAICLTGVDGGSQTNFSGDAATKFSLNWKDSKMANEVTQTPPATGKETGAGQQTTETVSKETPVDLAAERSKFETEYRGQLKRFTDKFGGEDGAKYFSNGDTFEAALEKHCTKLEQAAKDAVAGKVAAEEKLAKLDLGETSGVDTGPAAGGKGKTTFESLHKPVEEPKA